MKKIIKVIIVLYLVLNRLYTYGLSTEEVVGDIESKFNTIETYKAVYSFKVEDIEQRFTTEGTVSFKKPDRVKMEMLAILKEPLTQYVISNGKTMWVHIPKLKQASRIDLASLKEFFGARYFDYQEPNLCKPFNEVDKRTLRLLKTERLNGEDMYVFEAKPLPLKVAQGNMPENSIVRLWISANSGLKYKTSIFDDSGREIIQHLFKDFAINQLINDYEFEFKVPLDAEVADSTGEIRDKMIEVLKKYGKD